MTSTSTTMATWFGLADGRKDFWIQSAEDAALFFARADLDGEIQQILRKARRTDVAPKFVIYGDWGVGKTHTLYHVKFVLAKDDAERITTKFVDLPDITANTTFQAAHSAILDAIGLEVVKVWMMQYQAKHQAQAKSSIQALTQSEDIAKAFMAVSGYGDTSRLAWDWLRGLPLSSADSRAVGLPPELRESNHLASVLAFAGELSREIDDRTVTILLDEADKLRGVTKADAIYHWKNAFKSLADRQFKHLGLVIAASFRDREDIPEMLSDQQIITRFGENHYIHLRSFESGDARQFLACLLEHWINSDLRAQILSQYGGECEKEDVRPDTFPFTAPGLGLFVDYACRNGGVTTPRDLQVSLETILNRAIDDNRHIVSSAYMGEISKGH